MNSWRVGETLFEHYLITGVRGTDSSGTTYQVRHLDWEIDLLVKCPHPEVFASPEGRARFLSEAETWIRLPLHPHLASCYYILMQEELPYLFVENVAEGSLANWISDRRLYQGGHQDTLTRILTIAIHCAWGLHAAHEQGMVHQAFGSDCVLLTEEGVAKVTNFRPQAGNTRHEEQRAPASTPDTPQASASAEHPSDRQIDVWNWAASVLEMFTGTVSSQSGAVMLQAVVAHDEMHDSAIPPMPPALAQVLARCLEPHPKAYAANLLTLAAELQAIFAQELGHPFPQVFPQPARLPPHTLNNQALSLYHLGKTEAAKQLWDQALQHDPFHLEATYNRGVALWRRGELTDDMLVQQLEVIRATESAQSQEKRWLASYLLAQVHLERGDREAALQELQQARQEAPTQQWRADLSHQELVLSQQVQARQEQPNRRVLHESWQDAIAALSADGSRAIVATGNPELLGHHYPTSWCFWELGKDPRQIDITHWKRDTSSMMVNSISMRADGSEVLSGGFGTYASDGGDYPIVLLLGFRNRRRSFRIGLSGLYGEHIRSVSLSADGNLALIGGAGGFIGLWKVGTRLRLPILFGHMDAVTAVHLSADGRWAAAAGVVKTRHPLKWRGRDRTSKSFGTGEEKERRPVIRLWNTKTGRHIQLFQEDFVQAISLSADGRWLLSSCGRTLRLWEVATGRCVWVWRDQTVLVQTVSLSADGSLALSSSDSKVRIWDLKQGRCLRTLRGHEKPVTSLALSADGQVGISCGKSVRLWHIERSDFQCALYPSPIVTSGESIQLATHVSQILLQARHAREEGHFSAAATLMRELRSLPGYERAPEVLEEWRILTRFARRVHLRGAWLLRTLQDHYSAVDSVALSADGSQAISISGKGPDKTASIWDVETGRRLHTTSFPGSWEPLHLNGDGSRAFLVGYDNISVWDVKTGRRLRVFEHHAQVMYDAAAVHLSLDGRWLISASSRSDVMAWKKATARVWDVETGSCVAILSSYQHAAHAINLSLDGRWAITGSDDGTAELWDVIQGRCTCVLPQIKSWSPIRDVALSADGRVAAIIGDIHPVRVYDVTQKQYVSVLPQQANLASLGADGRLIITGGGATIGIWDVAQARYVSILPSHTAKTTSLRLSADGQRVIYRSWDGTIRVLQLDWELEAPDAADWDEGARSYLEAFLILHTPYTTALPPPDKYSAEATTEVVMRQGTPVWTEEDFQGLIRQLQYVGYGWLRAEGVRNQLEQMASLE